MGAAAGAGGLRPGVVDSRGKDWDCGPVRNMVSESPAAHDERGCPHHFVEANWMVKKGGHWQNKKEELIRMLVIVATWLCDGRDAVVHCIPL